MFDQIFGNYLVSAGTITKEQFMDVLESEGKIRVKLGLIAVAEKLMTEEQADEVNKLQSIMDRRFGDIAVEKGYLTDEQVVVINDAADGNPNNNPAAGNADEPVNGENPNEENPNGENEGHYRPEE